VTFAPSLLIHLLVYFRFLASINATLKERATRLGFASRRQSGIDRFCRKIHGVVELLAVPAAAHYYPLLCDAEIIAQHPTAWELEAALKCLEMAAKIKSALSAGTTRVHIAPRSPYDTRAREPNDHRRERACPSRSLRKCGGGVKRAVKVRVDPPAQASYSAPVHPKALSRLFPTEAFRRDVFAAAFLRVMCDLSAAPIRD
jgi:hypothetical protein